MAPEKNFFARHREFLLSWKTLSTAANGLLLLVAFLVSMTGSADIGQWIYLAAALVTGVPIVLRALKAVITERDITVDLMVAVAMVAAVSVGEYVAAALVVFMLSVGETLEDYTVSRADNALKELASLVPATVTLRRAGIEVVVPLADPMWRATRIVGLFLGQQTDCYDRAAASAPDFIEVACRCGEALVSYERCEACTSERS